MSDQQLTTTEAKPPAEVVQPGELLSAMVQMARDPAFDVEKFKVLADLQLRMEDRQAERMLTRDLQAVQKRIPNIPKRGKIDLGSKGVIPFATLADVNAALQPLLDEFGMTVSDSMLQAGDKIIIRTTVRHPSGASMSVDTLVPVDTGPGRNTTQAHMSSFSYGQRRGRKALFSIQDEDAADDNGAGAHHKVLTEEQVTELVELLKAGGASEAALLLHFYGDKYHSMDEAPAADYTKLKNAIQQRNAAAAKKSAGNG